METQAIETTEYTHTLPNKKRLVFIYIIIILGIIIFFLFEKFIFFLIISVFRLWLLSFFIIIFLHFLLIRYLVWKITFIGASKFFNKLNKYTVSKLQCHIILENIVKLDELIDKILEYSEISIVLTSYRSNLKKAVEIINYYKEILELMKLKYSLTYEQNIIYNDLIILKENLLVSNIYDFLEDDNSQAFKNIEQYKNNLNNLKNSIDNIKNFIFDYLNIGDPWYSIKRLKNIFKVDLFYTLYQLQTELNFSFDFIEKKFSTKDGKTLDYILIFADNKHIKNKHLMIICGPNGSSYQSFSRNINLDNYLHRGIDVLCYNYRGYGFSNGMSSFNNLRSDIIEIYDYMKSLGSYEKIGVHGISIGGIPACYLASKRDINLLVSDRNFGYIADIIKDYYFGEILIKIYKMFFFSNSCTIEDFINTKCYKIIINDPNDQIVKEFGSLKSGISEYIIKNYFRKKSNNNNESESTNTNNYFVNSEKNTILNTIDSEDEHIKKKNKKKNNNNINDNHNNINSLDLLLDNSHEKELFIKTMIEISHMLKDINLEYISTVDKIRYKILKIENFAEYDTQQTYEYIKKKIKKIFEDFESCGNNLRSINNYNLDRNKKNFLNDFFNNFLIFGCKQKNFHDNDIHYFTTKLNIVRLEEIIKNMKNFIEMKEIEKFKEKKIIKNIIILIDLFEKILNNFKILNFNINGNKNNNEDISISSSQGNLIDRNRMNLIEKNKNNYEDELKRIGKGNLIHIKCGHNGLLNYEEMKTFNFFLEKSKFLPNFNINKNEEKKDNKKIIDENI